MADSTLEHLVAEVRVINGKLDKHEQMLAQVLQQQETLITMGNELRRNVSETYLHQLSAQMKACVGTVEGLVREARNALLVFEVVERPEPAKQQSAVSANTVSGDDDRFTRLLARCQQYFDLDPKPDGFWGEFSRRFGFAAEAVSTLAELESLEGLWQQARERLDRLTKPPRGVRAEVEALIESARQQVMARAEKPVQSEERKASRPSPMPMPNPQTFEEAIKLLDDYAGIVCTPASRPRIWKAIVKAFAVAAEKANAETFAEVARLFGIFEEKQQRVPTAAAQLGTMREALQALHVRLEGERNA